MSLLAAMLWTGAALAEPCPAATTYARESGFAAGFESTFWTGFAQGFASAMPPEHQALVQERADDWWRPVLAPAVDQWRAETAEPWMGALVAEHIPCRRITKGVAHPVGNRHRDRRRSSRRWRRAPSDDPTDRGTPG